MYELSRVRLHSVGPKGARYQDVTLDLRDVGKPVAGPAQEALIPDVAGAGGSGAVVARRRPSPASVLFTENGSGKSVLMKLIFSVVLPGKRQVVGTTSSRVLENFVLDTDVAQVVLEWQHTVTGERLVTGKVSAWRGHVVSADPNRLTEAWYSFHPTHRFGLDTLPLSEQGRLVSLPGFRERLTEAGKADAGLQVLWETTHAAWTEHLDALDLDPALFVYQRRMNAGEGEAADAFSFASDEAFVDWLLRSVTDEEDPRELAVVLDGYASTLAQRESLEVEKDFVAGALERLGGLAGAAREERSAAAGVRAAELAGVRLVGALRRRREQESSRLSTLAGQGADLEAAGREAQAGAGRLAAVVTELRRRVAGLRLAEAEAARAELAAQRATARDELAAWQATGTLLRLNQARQSAESIAGFVGEKEADAEPILAERERAARRLVQGLIALAERADEVARQAAADAAGLDAKVAEADREEREHTVLAERHRGSAQTRAAEIAGARAGLDRLVQAGLLAPSEDVAAVAARAMTLAEDAGQDVTDAESEQGRLAAARRAAAAEVQEAERTARDREHDARAARERHGAAVLATDALAQQERLAELLGTDTVDLETDAATLVARLAEAVLEAEAERTGLHLAAATDRTVLEALGTGGLLPPPADVVAVRTALLAAGIGCRPGWEHLSKLPEPQRQAALRRHPELVDGVLLADPAQLEQAQEVLRAARLLPRSVVAVAPAADLSAGPAADPSSEDGGSFVVPPNPAMYDEDLAEAERQALLVRQRERDARLDDLDRRAARDRRLGDRLERWLRDHPAGTLAALESEWLAAEAAHREALERLSAVGARAELVTGQELEVAERLPGLREAGQERRRRAERLTQVAAEVARVPELEQARAEALEQARLADRTASAVKAEADRLRGVKEEKVRHGDDSKRIAVGCRREIADIPGGGSAQAGPVPEESVETLRAAYRTAAEAYAAVEVGQDLRARLDEAQRSEAGARAAVESLKPADRDGAARLLATPDSADGAGRAAATERAERALLVLDERVGAADGEVGRVRAAYEGFPVEHPSLAEYGEPAGIGEGEELIAAADADLHLARRGLDELTRQGAELTERRESARAGVDGLDAVVAGLGDWASGTGVGSGEGSDGEESDGEAFTGTVEAARERASQIRGQVNAARTRLAEQATAVRRASSALHKYAAEPRFERTSSPVRRQILAVEADVLATYADEWETALRPRLRTLTDDLAHIGRHRSQITTRLRGLVTTALTVLRAAERVSVLPDTLGDWAGQKFLRISFAEPDRATLDERLGGVVDEFAELGVAPDGKDRARGADVVAEGGRVRAVKRDGMSLLLKGVRAALPKGVKVEMLKPDASERAERVRIADVANVFSGGQLLTAAIILYCTMAALRANERGQSRRPHAGVLFLDNPIGRASAGYLLEMQLGVADALGVQLIYTTGLFDVNALSVFPLILRLRNDRDLRGGMRFLTVEDEIKRPLDALGGPDGTGQLTAARLLRRPGEPAPEPEGEPVRSG